MPTPEWYIYMNSAQTGPFPASEIVDRINKNIISQDAYLFKVGWKDWVPLESCKKELGIGPAAAHHLSKRLAPRASISGKIFVHNGNSLQLTEGVNISASGVFIETREEGFTIGEILSLTCKVKGLPKSFHAKAKVVRFNANLNSPMGYGLAFVEVDETVVKEIQKLIDHSNTSDGITL